MIRQINVDALLEWMNRHELTEDGGIDINELEEHINKMAVVRDIEPEDTIARQDAIMALCRTCTDDGKYYRDCKMYQIGICADVHAIESVPDEAPARCEGCDLAELAEAFAHDYIKVAVDEAFKRLAVVRARGTWNHVNTVISNEYGEIRTHHIWECSECDYEGNPDWPYCPKCGSLME